MCLTLVKSGGKGQTKTSPPGKDKGKHQLHTELGQWPEWRGGFRKVLRSVELVLTHRSQRSALFVHSDGTKRDVAHISPRARRLPRVDQGQGEQDDWNQMEEWREPLPNASG